MSVKDKDVHCREIITKAVCGKGRKFSQVSHTVSPPHAPTSILGAWIINNHFEAVKVKGGVEVAGTYDINIWYSYDGNTKTDVAKEIVSYVDVVALHYIDNNHRASTSEVTAIATQEPNCVEATISQGNQVLIRVEREFQVEMVAETKVCVQVCTGGQCDDSDLKVYDFDDGSDGEFGSLEDLDFLED